MDWGDYGDRVYGCWLGKAVGGTLGLATEGIKALADLPMEYPEYIEANDDLDLQLVWLDLLKEKGGRITSEDLASRWRRNITYAVDEYGVVNANIRAGLHPPVTGYYNNWFTRGMGAPIRSEIWACVAPGKPEVAAYFAYQDASVDHWGDGVYGEVFLAAFESMAFEESDVRVLIGKALEFIPESSEVFQVAQLVLKSVDEGLSLKESRQRILDRFGRENFTDCVQNIGFTLLGLLMGGGDFLKTMIYAINCGFDGDCTGATAGSMMGIILGRKEIDRLHSVKMNERIAVGSGITGIDLPKTLTELTEQTMEVGRRIASDGNIPALPRPFILPELPKFTPPLCLKFLVSTPLGQDAAYPDAMDAGVWSKAEFASNHIDLNAFFDGNTPQSIFLRTEFKIPASGAYKLFPSSSDGVSLWLDGEQILSHHEHGEFLPALHRPGSPLADVYLESGWHDAVIKVLCCKKPLEFSWIVAREDQHLVMDVEYRAPEGIPASV